MILLYVPFVIQGVLMGIDETIHGRRGLGTWERLGHPLDTLTVFVPLSMIAVRDYSDGAFWSFVLLSIFSCIFITKDEFIHTQECSAVENWIHSILFILHPMIFFCSGVLWKYYPDDSFVQFQPLIVGVFMLYQILRWSIPWKKTTK